MIELILRTKRLLGPRGVGNVGPSPLILNGARRNFLAECFPRKIVAFPSPTQDILSKRSLSSAQPATWYRLIKMA